LKLEMLAAHAPAMVAAACCSAGELRTGASADGLSHSSAPSTLPLPGARSGITCVAVWGQ
jgi:hypothetical protein